MTAHCPRCAGPLFVQLDAKPLGQRAERYEDCWHACQRCRIGLTNASGALRTFIRQDWKDGLWNASTAPRLEAVVAQSLNVRSREKKKRRLANERSEDLLTWNVFSWLEDCRLLDRLCSAGLDGVRVFYWGANDRHTFPLDLNVLLRKRFGESPQSLSEPDIILIGPQDVVFVEAKFGSPNERRPNDPRVEKYVAAMPDWFASPHVVRALGYYELTRNWAIGAAVATALGCNFTLVNLVHSGDELQIASVFASAITGKGVFQRRTWEEISGLDRFIARCLRRQTLYFQPAFPALSEESG